MIFCVAELAWGVRSLLSCANAVLFPALAIYLGFGEIPLRGLLALFGGVQILALGVALRRRQRPFPVPDDGREKILHLHFSAISLGGIVAAVLSLAAGKNGSGGLPAVLFAALSAVGWLAGFATLYRQAFQRSRRRTEFEFAGVTYRQLDSEPETLSRFIRPFAEEMVEDMDRGRVRIDLPKRSPAEIFERYDRLEREKSGPCYIRFNAFDGDRMVGGISLTLDVKGKRLPDELHCALDFNPLRRYGRVMEGGFVYISRDYRFRQEIFVGLFKCLLESAIEQDVSFILVSAVQSSRPIFEKLGFHSLGLKGICNPTQSGAETHLMCLNLASVVLKRGAGTRGGGAIQGSLDIHLLKRYVRRVILRDGWKPHRNRPWLVTPERIRMLCNPG
jgi:hypothetical protein